LLTKKVVPSYVRLNVHLQIDVIIPIDRQVINVSRTHLR